jgi:hypothetical protein
VAAAPALSTMAAYPLCLPHPQSIAGTIVCSAGMHTDTLVNLRWAATLIACRSPAGPIKPMKRAVNVSVAVMTAFYLVSAAADPRQCTPPNSWCCVPTRPSLLMRWVHGVPACLTGRQQMETLPTSIICVLVDCRRWPSLATQRSETTRPTTS